MVFILSYEVLGWFVTQWKLIDKALFIIAKKAIHLYIQQEIG